jgi:flagellar protein FlgJ
MIQPAAGSPVPNGEVGDAAKLRKATAQLEGVFIAQLFRAMRETVPQDGALEGGSGEAIFTSLMDEHVAEAAAVKQQNGLGDALYRQLVRRFDIDGQP